MNKKEIILSRKCTVIFYKREEEDLFSLFGVLFLYLLSYFCIVFISIFS